MNEWDYYSNLASSSYVEEESLDTYAVELYEENKKHIEEAKENGAPESVTKTLSKSNEDLLGHYNAILRGEKELKCEGAKEEIYEQKKETITMFSALGNAVKKANARFKVIGLSVYDALAKPFENITKILNQRTAERCEKKIIKLQRKYDLYKSKVDFKAKKRLYNKFNRINKEKYNEKNLPYKKDEKLRLDEFEEELKYYTTKKCESEFKIKKVVTAESTRELKIKENKAIYKPEEKKTVPNKESESPVNETSIPIKDAVDETPKKSENKTSEINATTDNKKYQVANKKLESMNLTQGQLDTAKIILRNYPNVNIENKFLNDIPVNKMLYTAYLYNETKGSGVSFYKIKELSLETMQKLTSAFEKEQDKDVKTQIIKDVINKELELAKSEPSPEKENKLSKDDLIMEFKGNTDVIKGSIKGHVKNLCRDEQVKKYLSEKIGRPFTEKDFENSYRQINPFLQSALKSMYLYSDATKIGEIGTELIKTLPPSQNMDYQVQNVIREIEFHSKSIEMLANASLKISSAIEQESANLMKHTDLTKDEINKILFMDNDISLQNNEPDIKAPEIVHSIPVNPEFQEVFAKAYTEMEKSIVIDKEKDDDMSEELKVELDKDDLLNQIREARKALSEKQKEIEFAEKDNKQEKSIEAIVKEELPLPQREDDTIMQQIEDELPIKSEIVKDINAKDVIKEEEIIAEVENELPDMDKLLEEELQKEPESIQEETELSEEYDVDKLLEEKFQDKEAELPESEKIVDIEFAADLNSSAIHKGTGTSMEKPIIESFDNELITDVKDCEPENKFKEERFKVNTLSESIALKAYNRLNESLPEGDTISFHVNDAEYTASKEDGKLVIRDEENRTMSKTEAIKTMSNDCNSIRKDLKSLPAKQKDISELLGY